MTVYATSNASTTLSIGGVWVISVRITDADGEPAYVTPTVTVTLPGGSAVTPTAEDYEGDGQSFRALYEVGSAGRYVARVVAAGYGAADFTTYVSSVVSGSLMPVLGDVSDYLGENSWSDAEIEDALAAESAAQRSVCAVPADYPDDLRQALLRRVARNLAMRQLPLAVLTGDAESGSTVLPGRDPEVRRLEAPFRKLVVG